MAWIARHRVILCLTGLAIGPALLLDVLVVGQTSGLGWNVLMGIALWFGAPYYLAQVLIGAVAPNAPLHVYAIGAAVMIGAIGIALDLWLRRKVRRRGAALPEAAT
jgi:hypothetical protein